MPLAFQSTGQIATDEAGTTDDERRHAGSLRPSGRAPAKRVVFYPMKSVSDSPSVLNGEGMHALARRLWPLHRSITGDGTRKTLRIIQEVLPDLLIHEIPSGTQVFDWTIPDEWSIRSATLTDSEGDVVVDYADSNLNVVGYSVPVDAEMDLEQLQEYLHL